MPQPATRTDRFTYADYRGWGEDERWELIDGQVYDMSPAPVRVHQDFVVELTIQVGSFLRDKGCRLYVAPFDVRLPEADEADDEINSVVQPDVVVICDSAKLDDKGCRGAPDWIVEVLSPRTAAKDQIDKRDLYQRHGVREYWLLHPTDRVLTIYRLVDGVYHRPDVRALTGSTEVSVIEGLSIQWPAMVPEGDSIEDD